jgi:rhodanese-related sulfurtransferase
MRRLAYLAAALGGAASLAGSPYAAHHGAIDVEALSRAVANERDHVTAIELAEWIKERRPDLRVVDVRTREEFEAFHIPTAERIAIDSLAGSTLRPRDIVVLYSEGGAHAAQAWVFLRALGYQKVYFLRGGIYDWVDQIVSPEKASEMSRYFGGVARAPGTAASLSAVRRRGC